MTIDIEKARARLVERRNELKSLSKMSAHSREAVSLDQQSVGRLSRMDAMQQQAMAQATERNRAAELARIERAIRLLDEGEYGYCVSCGEEIVDKRLEVDPTAIVCTRCASS